MLLGCRCIESATALRVPPTLMTTPHWRPTCVGAVATQGTLAVAALAAHLHRRRRHTGDARRPHLSQQLAPATSHRPPRARRPHPASSRAAAQPPTRRACRAVPSAPPALVSDPRHLSHTATLCLTNTDISSLPYKTPWNFYREGMILPVFGFVYPEVRE